MIAHTENDIETMLTILPREELLLLLRSFFPCNDHSRAQLRGLAFQIFARESSAAAYPAYLVKIVELYYSLKSNRSPGCVACMSCPRPLFMVVDTESYRAREFIKRAIRASKMKFGLNQTTTLITNLRDLINGQRFIVLAETLGVQVQLGLPTFDIPIPVNVDVTWKKSPFEEVLCTLMEPKFSFGMGKYTERSSSVSTTVAAGFVQESFSFTFTVEQANLIASNRSVFQDSYESENQVHVRICEFRPEATEQRYSFPPNLFVRVNESFTKNPRKRITHGPVDCTRSLSLNPIIPNTVTIYYNPNARMYAVGIYLIKEVKSEKLLRTLLDRVPRNSDETKNRIVVMLSSENSGLIVASIYFSLICPINRQRMKYPAKSINCANHLACFDANSFIVMNENQQSWVCPICRNSCSYDDLRIDSYFLEIVNDPGVPENCGKIEIFPNGTWKITETLSDEHVDESSPIICVDSSDSDE